MDLKLLSKSSGLDTRLLLAAEKKNINTVKFLINAGANINCSNSCGNTVLHYASEYGWFEIVQSLLKKGADIHVKTKYGDYPLLLASKNKHKDIIELLVNSGADINCFDSLLKYTTLHCAAASGWVNIVQSLLNKGADIQVKTKHGDSPLLLAAKYKHEGIVELLINAGADVNCPESNDKNYTVLHYASKYGWCKIAHSLLHKGANIQIKCKCGDSPLLLAVKYGHEGNTKLLIDAGADINSSENQNKDTVFCQALKSGWLEVVKSLLKKGADIEVKLEFGHSPLLRAAKYRHKDIVELLICAGANINCFDSWDNYTVLHYASANGWIEIVQSLLNKGADIHVTTKNGESPLLLAAEEKRKDIVELLIKEGANTNCSDNVSNYTVLHHASANGWIDIVQYLLNKGAEIEVETKFGYSPLFLAADHGHIDIVELFINEGADISRHETKRYYTLLHWASENGWIEIVQCLLNKGADIEVETIFGDSPLLLAAENTNKDVVELLIKAGANINCYNLNNYTLLHYASQNGWFKIVQHLINKEAYIDVETEDNYSPLHMAAENDHVDIVEFLINEGANCSKSRIYNKSLLHYASRNGWLKVVQSLLEKGANIEADTGMGTTPLQEACLYDKIEIAEHLIKAGADVNVDNNGGTILSTLIRRKSPDIKLVSLLIKSGAYLKSVDYGIIMKNTFLIENILQDAELCSQSFINIFNHKDLPELYKQSIACKILPSIEHMRIPCTENMNGNNCLQVAHEVIQCVKNEIQMKGHCNVLKINPMVLKMMSVKSFLNYCNNIKKRDGASEQMKRPAEFGYDNRHTKHSSKMIRFN